MNFKRILPVLLIFCLLVGLLPITASAASVKVAEWWIEDGSINTVYAESNNVWSTFESTWNTAMEAADRDHTKMMHFKLYTDWNADGDGDFSDYTFSSGSGFNYWTIYIQDGARVTLDLNGHMINRRLTDDKSNGEVIYVDEWATLVIEDSDPDVVHRGEVGTDGLWRPGGSGINEISGGIITGGYSSNGAGGIHMKGGTHVVLKGGTIAGNASTEGTIKNEGGGGGVQLENNRALLEMYEGAAIKYNAATDNDGGGVEVWNGSFVMYGGEVSYNRACDDGGGVHTYEDDGIAFQMYGGMVVFNEADRGGGVYIDSSVLIDGGIINANAASSYGGGIYFNDDDSPIVKNASISYNGASRDGGGVYVNTEDVEISNTKINGNVTTYGDGGGIWCSYDGLSLSGCELIDNYAAGTGSAIYVPYSMERHECSLSECEIRDDSGKIGVYFGGRSTLSLSGKMYIGAQGSAWLYLGIETLISADGVTYSEVWLDTAANVGEIISNDRGTHNVTGFRYTDGQRGLLWVNDPYSGDYRKIRVVSAQQAGTSAETEIVPYYYSETDDMVYTVGGRDYVLRKGVYTYSSANDSTRDNDAIFYYSDGYFDKTPDEYDTHLATMSMNLAMSGFYSSRGQAGTCYYFYNEEIPYTGETDYINRHANVRQMLANIGVSDENIYVNDDYIIRPTPDTIGVAVGQKPLCYKDGTATGYTLVPVVIRSANYEQEWVSNVTLGDGSENNGEAKGFSTAADMAMDVVEGYIADFGLTDAVAEGKVKFWVVGYSRGGATANILSKRLTDKYSDPSNGGCQVFGYCFEAPQGGVDKAVVNEAHTYNGQYLNIHNCINVCDLVPMVGPTQMGFHRYGVDHRVPGDPQAGEIITTEKQVTNDSPYTRNDGENFTRVTTYADNAAYYVKPVNGYIGNRSDAALSTYYTQRALAEAQLRAVSQGIVLDDYFYTADLNYVSAIFYGLLEVTGDVNSIPRMDQWLDDFVGDLMNAALPSRTFFATTPVSLRKDGITIGGLTFEQAIRNAIGLVFALPAEKMNELTGLIGWRWSLLFEIPEVISLWDDALGDWDDISEADRAGHIQELWKVIDSFGIGDVLSQDEYEALKAAWPTLADVLIRFVSVDYDNKLVPGINETQAHLGTLFYNISRIGANHYPEINLAWLRSYDSFYTTDIQGTETGVTTRVTIKRGWNAANIEAYVGEKHLINYSTQEIEFEGAQTLTLSTPINDGDAIYYTVTKDGVDDDTVRLYRDGIELLPNHEYTSYVIHAYTMQCGAKSSTYDYYIRLHQEPRLCKIVSRSLTLSGGLDLNVYCRIDDPEALEKAYMRFTVDENPFRVEAVTFEDATLGDDGLYCFTLPLNVLELAQNITASFYSGDECVTSRTSTVRGYLWDVTQDYSDDEKLDRLARAIAAYGQAAQIALSQEHGFTLGDGPEDHYHRMLSFSFKDPDTTVDLSAYASTVTGSLDRLGQVTRQLALDGRTDLYINMDCEDGYVPDVTVTDCNGNDAEFSLVPLENGAYRIIIPEIAAHELGDFYTVRFFDGGKEAMTIQVCALSYAYSILRSPTRTRELKNAMAALAEYYFAAIDYAGR